MRLLTNGYSIDFRMADLEIISNSRQFPRFRFQCSPQGGFTASVTQADQARRDVVSQPDDWSLALAGKSDRSPRRQGGCF
jgi:hypothetical protein